ncbi:proteasome accessory factor PafA2 [Brachybacterium endophyticum]|uniref:Proteasome accessory factor PafA2 n=1 Tax=Brachybacterium endophyticum TaxID=2182385 RepID=A0A2U2RIR3_9MICO|nr:depupylase/deamidase Dop [Brachybacterium endophyticum]PWH05674.1 proteasome accessory factor PafA2 [Brachybacterium endophyticum]
MSDQAPDARRGLVTERVMGIETEFGILDAALDARTGEASSSIALSHLVVGAYGLLHPAEGTRGRRVRWDYGDESPLRDARGFEIRRAAAHPTQLTDQVHDAHLPSIDMDMPLQAPEIAPEGSDAEVLAWAARRSIGNTVLSNGARLYVDHAHPEYSSPEVTSAREAVLQDRAGEVVAQRAMELLAAADGVPEVALYKNNTDGKGASYGTHENYLLARDVPFERVVQALLPFFATRQILVGAGRVGLGTRGTEPGFQISSRADFFEEKVGLETTLDRPIVNTRDEPHADAERHRRLHVIIGDANLLETSTFLKMGMTSLVLAALEAEQESGARILPVLELADPVQALRDISHDPTLTRTVPLADGRELTALQIQRAHLEAVSAHADRTDPETAEVLDLWSELLQALETEPARAADRIEWVAKHQLLESYRARAGLDWGDARLRAIDLQFGDLRPQRSLFTKLRSAGRVATLVSDQEVEEAVGTPPASTRAYLRGRLVRHHRGEVASTGWDVITLAAEDGSTTRVRLADPRIGSRPWCEALGLDPEAALPDVLEALARAAADTATVPGPDADAGSAVGTDPSH